VTIEAYTVDIDSRPPGEHHAWAMAQGARCDQCSMRNAQRGPVPPSIPDNVDVLVVAEAPGHNEIDKGETLIGASGREIRTALRNAGADMSRVGFTNAALCAPLAEMKKHLQEMKRRKLPSVIDCCRPRLLNELKRARFAVLMGGASLTAVGVNASIMKMRGAPLQIPNGPMAVPIPHAAFVMREEGRTMRPIFHADVTKAVRISRGGNTWRDPAYFVPRSAAEVENFLVAHPDRLAVDVETDGKDAWTCGLRRVGIGNATEVMIYSPLSVKGHLMLPEHEIQAQSRAIAGWLQRAPRVDLHNGIAFDSVVLWRHGMPLVDEKVFDTLVAHQIGVTSELPHRLDFLGSVYTDAPFWKDSFKHSNVRDDALLDRYLSYDIAVTYTSAPYVEQNLTWAQQTHIYGIDAELFRIGRSMSAIGIGVDQAKRLEFAVEYQEKSDRLLAEFKAVAGRDINPGSYPQVRKLLYEDLGLPMLDDHYTDSGEASTDENTLLDLLGLGLDERATRIIHGLIGYREAEKILGTNTGHVENGKLVGGPPVHADGRLRAVWRPGKTSGRWGSNEPNMQNIPKRLRAMFTPALGNVFVAADMSAVELRMIALLAGDEPLIQAFQAFDEGRGPDVHIFNACGLFRCQPKDVNDEVRNFVKRFVYALNYDAQPPTIFQTLSLLRDDNLRPLFPHITLPEVERTFSAWWKLHPAILEWKKMLIRGWRSVGYIATQFHKRKRFFIGGESATEMGNLPIQGASADLQNTAIAAVVAAYPFDYANHRGLVVNGHDQIVVECAQHEAEDMKRIIQQAMAKRIGPMLFPADPKVAGNWKEAS
jgi:uracil-DNA glycosylase family 4